MELRSRMGNQGKGVFMTPCRKEDESVERDVSIAAAKAANRWLNHFIYKRTNYRSILDKLNQCKIAELKGKVLPFEFDEIEDLKIELNNLNCILYANNPQHNSMYITRAKPKTQKKSENEKDEDYVAAKNKINELKKQLGGLSWYRVSKKLDDIRKLMKTNDIEVEAETGYEISHGRTDINSAAIVEEYSEICENISQLLNMPVTDVRSTKTGSLRITLQEQLLPKYNKLNDELKKLKFDFGKRANSIADKNGIMGLMFDLCFPDGDVTNEKNLKDYENLLTNTSIKFVSATVFSVCAKLKMAYRYADAFSYAMVGLITAVKKYIEQVQEHGSASQNFLIFAKNYVSGYCRNGLCEMSTNGLLSASTFSGMLGNLKTKQAAFKKMHSSVKDGEDLGNMMENVKDENDKFIESFTMDYESSYGSDDESNGNGAVFANIVSTDITPEKICEARIYHDLFLDSVSEILNTKNSKGENIFDEHDIKLFELMYGFSPRKEVNAEKVKIKTDFTNSELCDEMNLYFMNKGYRFQFTTRTLMQRINKINTQLKHIVKSNPCLFNRLKSIHKEYNENPEYMRMVSEEREEKGFTFMRSNHELDIVGRESYAETENYNSRFGGEYVFSEGMDITEQAKEIFESYV